jgi:hypothetical protein
LRCPLKRRVIVTAAALVVAFIMGGAMAYAQGAVAEIGFPFTAAGKEMPAGKYSVNVAANFQEVQLTAPDRSRVIMAVLTVLGRHDKDTDPEFVFDKVDGKLVLSEVWLPGQDGLLLVATKGPHSHAVVGGSNPRK